MKITFISKKLFVLREEQLRKYKDQLQDILIEEQFLNQQFLNVTIRSYLPNRKMKITNNYITEKRKIETLLDRIKPELIKEIFKHKIKRRKKIILFFYYYLQSRLKKINNIIEKKN